MNPDARGELLPTLKGLRAETNRRAENHEFVSPGRKRMVSAWNELCQRIGFGE